MLNNEDDFIEKIILQNALTNINFERKISIIRKYKVRNDKETVILEIDSNTILYRKKKKYQ